VRRGAAKGETGHVGVTAAKDVRQREKRKNRICRPGDRDVSMVRIIFLVFQRLSDNMPISEIRRIISADRGSCPQLRRQETPR
jgi:hypothetical protein